MNIDCKSLPMPQRTALFYIERNECKEYGVIVRSVTGESLLRKGLAEPAPRRSWSRDGGVCLRLTSEGRRAIKRINGEA